MKDENKNETKTDACAAGDAAAAAAVASILSDTIAVVAWHHRQQPKPQQEQQHLCPFHAYFSISLTIPFSFVIQF